MSRISFQIGLIGLICTIFLLNSTFAGFICPPSSEIRPCKCGIYRESATEENGYAICHGREVTQEAIARVFSALRRVNELSPADWLTLSYFRLAETNMTTLDLTPLFYTRAKLLTLYNNTELVEILGSPIKIKNEEGNSTSSSFSVLQNEGLIQVEDVTIGQSPITTATFESGWLRYFSVEHLKKFTVGNSQLTQVPQDLSSFVHLKTLEFWNSRIQGVGGGQFKQMSNLTQLLFTVNELEYIGENAFEFEFALDRHSHSEDLKNSHIKISLDSNKQLNETSFHRNWAGSLIKKTVPSSRNVDQQENQTQDDGNMTLALELANTNTNNQRPIYLDLSWTNLTTLPSEIFQGFLDFHPQNEMKLFGAPLKCDNRVAWLKNEKSAYEKRVHVFNTCQDGGSIFTSDLNE